MGHEIQWDLRGGQTSKPRYGFLGRIGLDMRIVMVMVDSDLRDVASGV
jgi:hypothetical protein